MDDTVPGGAKRTETIVDRLRERFIDSEGQPPARETVAGVVEQTAQQLGDANVQDFVPLLIENQASERLRELGMHADLTSDDDDPDCGRVHEYGDERDRRSSRSPAEIPLPPR